MQGDNVETQEKWKKKKQTC